MSRLTLNNGVWTLNDDISLTPISSNTIDLTDTSTWTLLEPDAMTYGSVTNSNNINTLSVDTFTHNASDYRFDGSTVMKWPRHYAELKDVNNNNVTTNDTFVLQIKISDFDYSSSDDQLRIAIGCCIGPTTTGSAEFMGYGVGRNVGSNTTIRELQVYDMAGSNAAATQNTNDTHDTIYGQLTFSNTYMTHVHAVGEENGVMPTVITAADRINDNTLLTSGSNWYIFVGTATRLQASITGPKSFSFKAEYQVVKLR